jgi:uncharacterized protein
MSTIVLEQALKCLFADKKKGEVDFLYHAGEPMSIGRGFYEEALRIIDKYKPQDLTITNVIQTNGTLIDEEWAKFFATNNFRVGVSIDGPKFLHDLNRKNWSNMGSFDKAIRGFKLLKKHGVEGGVLTVITAEHLNHPDELINFYIDNEMTDVGFNIEEIENFNKESSLGTIESIEGDKYSQFMNRVTDLALKQGDSIKIREISDLIYLLFSKQQNPTHYATPLETRDLGIVTIQRNGDITTYCPEFAGMKSEEYNNFVIGNVLQINKLSEVEENPNYKRIKTLYDQRKDKCKSQCRYYSVCGSAFLSNAYSESASLLTTENIGCVLHKQRLTDVILTKLQQLSTL